MVDEGSSLRVEIRGTVREVDEAKRDCGERARIAAVLIAMALEPPLVSPSDSSKASSTSAPSGSAQGSAAPGGGAQGAAGAASSASTANDGSAGDLSQPRDGTRAVDGAEDASETAAPSGEDDPIELAVELSALVSFGLGTDPVGASVGPLLALRGARGPWTARAAVGLLPSQELTLGEGSAHMTRLPMDIGVGYAMELDGWSLEPALGIALDPFFVEGSDLAASSREVRLDVGPRATLQASLGSSAVRGLAALRAAWFPRTYELVVNPTGTIGTTPGFWLELTFGARFGLD